MIDVDAIRYHLRDELEPVELVAWFRSAYMEQIIGRLNTDDVRRRLALHPGDVTPTNERNLTDVRNRISLILEYELARISNELLEQSGEHDLYWSYVVSNRYPDLEARWRDGRKALRIEMKCLQSVAEEKAANFDALIKDLDPRSDMVVVLLWEWKNDESDYKWKCAPWIEGHFVFHARSLAKLRDHYWLNRPPASLGDGYQGFDLRYGVTCRNGMYSEEEGNYGKLMRIWNDDVEPKLELDDLLASTESEYFRMRRSVVDVGFNRVARDMIARLTDLVPEELSIGSRPVGLLAGDVAVVAKWKVGEDGSELLTILKARGIRIRVELNEKYVCSGFRFATDSWKPCFAGLKPKAVGPDCLGLV